MVAWRIGVDLGRNRLRLVVLGIFLMALGLNIGASRLLAAPPSQSTEDGQALFEGRCTACHTIGQGDLLGPDLKDVTTRRAADWLARFLAAPDQVIASGDPIATDLVSKYGIKMPNLGLTETEVADLIAYLETQSVGASQPQPTRAPTATPSEGDAEAGKDLFTGATRFQSGGPPCLACHRVSDVGALGGGALGPDLTSVHTKLGDAVVTWPQVYPPMKEIYSTKTLTGGEKEDLLAFFKSVAALEGQPQSMGQLALLTLMGVVLLFGLAQLLWWRRLRGVRRDMVARQTSPFHKNPGGK